MHGFAGSGSSGTGKAGGETVGRRKRLGTRVPCKVSPRVGMLDLRGHSGGLVKSKNFQSLAKGLWLSHLSAWG